MASPVPIGPQYRIEDMRDLQPLPSWSTPIRRRPGMYLGDTDSRGLNLLIFELTANSLAEVVFGYGKAVRVTLRADGSAEVSDEGRTPPDVTRAFSAFGYGPHGSNFDQPGRAGFFYAVANALSARFTVFAGSDGSVYQHVFR